MLMLQILVPALTPRVTYTFALLAELWGLTAYELRVDGEELPPGPRLAYGLTPRADAVTVPCLGLLLEEAPRTTQLPWRWGPAGELEVCPLEAGAGEFDCSFDLPAAVFALASGYESAVQAHLDAHGRYDLAAYPSAAWGLDRTPWVHLWAEGLWARLAQRFPGLPRQRPSYQAQLTVDIDAPWKHRHKGPLVMLGGLLRAVGRGRGAEVQERLRAWLLGQDPYQTFDQLIPLMPPAQSTFFCLLARHSPHDGRFTWQHGPYQALLRQLADEGYPLGLHPSYTSYLNADQIATEAGHLQQLLDRPVTRSRQHFLRYRLPDTYRALLAAGITDDYTLCRYDRGGFPHGMARPFLWFDLTANAATTLTLHPSILMDRTLQQYLGLSPTEAVAHARGLIDTTRAVGGTFTLLLHNDSLSESGEWRGWRESIQAIIHLATRDQG
jgi:hypothetical protein